VLGGLGVLGFLILQILIPKDGKKVVTRPTSIVFLNAWQQLGRERTALVAISFGFLLSVANDNLFVVYGAWLEKAFSVSIVALGLGTSTIGVAELLGESMTAFIGDRLGLKRSVMLGLSLSVVSYGILPLFGQTLYLALGGLFMVFLTFEFTIVSFLSLCTELVPGSRATMMASFFAAAGIGRIVGALLGGPIWLAGGVFATSLVSATISAVALTALVWGLKGWRRGS